MKNIILFVFLLTFYCSSVESSRRVSASGDPEDIFFEKDESTAPDINHSKTQSNSAPQEKTEKIANPRSMQEPESIESVTAGEKNEKDFDEVGLSSWYGSKFQGKKTASGEAFDKEKLTAAHPSLPIGTIVKIYNFDTQKETTVRINDRGPYADNRILDVTEKTAELLHFKHAGIAKVGIKVMKVGNGAIVPADKVEEEPVADDEELELTAAIQEDKTEKQPPVKENKTVPVKENKSSAYFIQLGVFKDKAGAEKIKESIQSEFKETVKVTEKNGLYIVQLGNFKDRKQAELLRDKMKSKGIDCFIPIK